MSDDFIARKLTSKAMRKTALSGGLSNVALTGSEFLLTLPEPTLLSKISGASGVISSISAEIISTTQIQMQLIFDLAYLYEAPYDLNDYEDIWSVFASGLGIKGVEPVKGFSNNIFIEIANEQFQQWIRDGITKSVRIWMRRKLIPIIARYLTINYLTRLIPVANIIIGAGSNFYTTNDIGKWGSVRARIRRETFLTLNSILAHSKEHARLIAGLVFMAVTADKKPTVNGVNLFNQIVKRIDPTEKQKLEMDLLIHSSAIQDKVFTLLRDIKDEELSERLFKLALICNAASNLIPRKEDHAFLRKVGELTGFDYHKKNLTDKIEYFMKF